MAGTQQECFDAVVNVYDQLAAHFLTTAYAQTLAAQFAAGAASRQAEVDTANAAQIAAENALAALKAGVNTDLNAIDTADTAGDGARAALRARVS